jgi:hypothetical protein
MKTTNTDGTDGTEVAVFHAVGSGRMSVTEDMSGCAYTFRITGRTNTLTISDEEAATLAEAILERTA